MTPTAPTPDAILCPERLKRGSSQWERLDSVLSIAERILELPRGAGRLRRYGADELFITGNAEDSVYGGTRTPLAGRPRYAWIERPGGMKWGYLLPEVRAYDERERETRTDVVP